MEAKQVTLWVYANNEQEVSDLQKELNKFVMDKYNQGIILRAAAMTKLLRQHGNNPLVNAFLN